ncbi:MAG: hypothetical protein ACI9WU_000886 [Myxococcota bacterium]|jgi:hypothetical protein
MNMSLSNPAPRLLMLAAATLMAGALTGCEMGNGDSNTLDPLENASVRAFKNDYIVRSNSDLGKLSAYTHLEGDLVIEPWEELIEVDLPKLIEIKGSLRIKEVHGKDVFRVHAKQLIKIGLNVQVVSASTEVSVELPKVDFIGGHIDLSFALVSVSAPRLTTINGDIRARDITFKGEGLALGGLEHVNGSIRLVRYSADYEDVSDFATDLRFPDLVEISGGFEARDGSITTIDMPNLVVIGADIEVTNIQLNMEMPKLHTVLGHLRMRDAALTHFNLTSLQYVQGMFEMVGCQMHATSSIDLPALKGLSNTAGINISGIGNLQAITFGEEFEGEAISKITIAGNANLGSVNLGGMTNIHSDLVVSGNGPVEVHATQLVSVGSIYLDGNAQIKAYFTSLDQVYGSISVKDTQVHGFVMNNVETIGGDLKVAGMSVVTEDPMLTGLRYVNGSVYFGYNSGIPTIVFGALEQIGAFWQGQSVGDLQIEGNPHSTNLALPALASVARHMTIKFNKKLEPHTINLATQAVQVGGNTTICENGEFSEPPCPQ